MFLKQDILKNMFYKIDHQNIIKSLNKCVIISLIYPNYFERVC